MDKETLTMIANYMGIETEGKTNTALLDLIKSNALDAQRQSNEDTLAMERLYMEEKVEAIKAQNLEEEARAAEIAHNQKIELLRLEADRVIALAEINSRRQAVSSETQCKALKLNKLSDNDNPLVFFEAAERLMKTKQIPEAHYASIIVESLTGKALHAYASMAVQDVSDYAAIKKAVLKRFNVSAESSRLLFREARHAPSQSFSEFGIKISGLACAWVNETGARADAEKLFNLIVLEQFLSQVPEDLRIWLIDKKPKDVFEAGELADSYQQARQLIKQPTLQTNTDSESSTLNAQHVNNYGVGTVPQNTSIIQPTFAPHIVPTTMAGVHPVLPAFNANFSTGYTAPRQWNASPRGLASQGWRRFNPGTRWVNRYQPPRNYPFQFQSSEQISQPLHTFYNALQPPTMEYNSQGFQYNTNNEAVPKNL